jgi:hypothetical protein
MIIGIEGLKIRENHGGRKPRITDESKEIILPVLFNDPHIFGYLRWSLRPSGESEEICDEDYMEKTDTDMG